MIMMMMIANDCARVHRGCCLQGSTVDRLTYAHAESKKELIQKLEREREAVLKAQTSKKVFVPSFIRRFLVWWSLEFRQRPIYLQSQIPFEAGHFWELRRVERSRAPLVVDYVSVYAIRIKTPQVYTNAKSEELAKKLEASGNTAKHRMYLGSQKSPAGSPTSSTASGLDLCLRMFVRPRTRKTLG